MANRWWTGQVGLTGMEQQSDGSPSMKNKPDLGISISEQRLQRGLVGGEELEEDRENSDEPREGAVEGSSRRPRGRPPESKNKPKPPIFVTRDSPNALKSHVMEISSGSDIVDSIAQFSRKRQRGVCVISGSGTVSNVTLKHPNSTPTSAVMALHGRFEILSLTGAFLPGPAPPGSTGLTIYLAGGQGQVVGGSVVSPLVASGPVMIISATFSNATYERLPLEEEEEEEEGGSRGHGGLPIGSSGGGGSGVGGSPPPGTGPPHGGGGGMVENSSSMPMFNMPRSLVPNGGGAQLNHESFAWAAQGRAPY